MKLTKIYTRTGDEGLTSLVGGQRTPKDSARLEAYGTMDELSSHIGLLAAMISSADADAAVIKTLERIQCDIFNACTFLATDTSQTPIYPSARLDKAEVEELEHQIDNMNSSLPRSTVSCYREDAKPRHSATYAAQCAAGRSGASYPSTLKHSLAKTTTAEKHTNKPPRCSAS